MNQAEDEYEDDDWQCFEDTCVCSDGMCGESEADDDADVCADCGRLIHSEDVCGVCGRAMCFGCFEMGAGVCKGPHRK